MQVDDERLQEAQKQMIERVNRYDARIVAVLKNHLGCEQFLNELLAAASRRWKNRPFAGKIYIAKGLFLRDVPESIWKILDAGNQLRSAVVHGKKEGTIAEKLSGLRKSYLSAVSPEQRPGVEAMDDSQLVTSAFTFCGAFLVVATDRLVKEKKR